MRMRGRRGKGSRARKPFKGYIERVGLAGAFQLHLPPPRHSPLTPPPDDRIRRPLQRSRDATALVHAPSRQVAPGRSGRRLVGTKTGRECGLAHVQASRLSATFAIYDR